MAKYLAPIHKLLAVQVTQNIVSVRPPSKTTFVRLRKRVQAKHILGGLEINWGLIEKHLWMDGPPMLSRADLENQLFLLRSGQHLPPIRGETERGGGRGRNAETHSGGAALTRLLGWPSVCLPRLYGATPIINHTLIG